MTARTDTVEVPGCNVQLLAECVRIELPGGRHKLITYATFSTLISGFLAAEEGAQSEYLLSGNEYYICRKASVLQVMLYYPETIGNITYTRDGTKPRVIPNVVISVEMDRSTSADTWDIDQNKVKFFCTQRPLIEMPRAFFSRVQAGFLTTVPFTNIYQDGKMCFGSNATLPHLKLPDLRPLHSFYHTLVTSPFNDDLGIASGSSRSIRDWYYLTAELADRRKKGELAPFPYTDLSNLNQRA